MSLMRLNAFAGNLKGASGNAVYVRSPYGTILRNRPMVWNEPSEKQIEARQRMASAGRAWSALTLTQAAAWKQYAAQQIQSTPRTDETPPPSTQNVFVRLALKVLHVDPTAPIPANPPTTAFLGDAVTLDVTAEPGAIRFTPSEPNAPGIITELLLQPLKSVHRRTYLSKYRTAAFVAFGSGPHDLAVKPGVYAVAYCFVRAETGQETGIAELGTVVV
ncbi:MAG: hypothetical protein K1X67_08710 [Fimbriimonadaceae bacterium]|nr:hypothetical protein [Fimbriimonadaceae bacterium]